MSSDTTDKLRSLSIDRDAATSESGGPGVFPIVAVVLIVALAAALAWSLMRTPAAPAADPSPAAPSAPIAASSNADTSPTPAPAPVARSGLIASGYVVARRRATVSADLTGRVEALYVEEGDAVEAGQELARLDATLAELDAALAADSVAAARANVAAIQADLREARRELARTQALVESEVTSPARLDAVTARVETTQAQLNGARANLEVAETAAARADEIVDRHRVIAPFSGVVIDKNAQVGEIVSPTSAGGGFTRTGVYTLVDMASLEIEVDVNEGSIGRITPGDPATAVLDAYPDWRIPARVAAIIPTADRSRATIQVRVAFEETDARILPDMAAKVTFPDS